MTELRNRGVDDMFIACVDGLEGFPDAIAAPTREAAELALDEFGLCLGRHESHHQPGVAAEPGTSKPFFAFPTEIRKVIYTTNAVESLNMSLRKIIKRAARFPMKNRRCGCSILALRNHAKQWSTIQNWLEALNRFQLLAPMSCYELVQKVQELASRSQSVNLPMSRQEP